MPNAVVSDKFGHEQIENYRAPGNRNIFLATINGVQIVSTLNPYAVEFYPLHIRQQSQNRGDFNIDSQAQQELHQLQTEETEQRERQEGQHLEPQKDVTADHQTCAEDSKNHHIKDNIKETKTDNQMRQQNFEKTEGFENQRSSKLQISIEDISEELINEIKEETGYFQLPQKKCMKIVEIVAIEEITDEIISKPKAICKNTKEKIISNNAMLDAKRLFFGTDLELDNNTNDEGSTIIDKNSDNILKEESTKTTNMKSTNKEIKYNTNIEDMGDHNHAYESDTDVQLQINKVSRSQTEIKPQMNVEILDGKAPPTSPRNDVYIHSQLIVQKRKYLSAEETKKRKFSNTSKSAGKNTIASGIIRKLPDKTTCREPTVSSTIKERPKVTSTNRVKPLSETKKIETTRQKLPTTSTARTCLLHCQTSNSSASASRSTSRIKSTSDYIRNQKAPAIVISRPAVTPSVPRSSVSQKSLKTTTDSKNSSILKAKESMIRTSCSTASANLRKSNNTTHLK